MNAALVASALALGGLSGVGTTSALAQAPGGAPPAARGALPASPATRPAPAPRVSTWQKITKMWTNIVGEDTGHSVYRKDTGTGRDELPGSKPWSVPIR
jgi:hypothetical protein